MENRSLYRGLFALQPPAHIERTVRMRGGLNPYGEPMYRLVWAKGRTILSGGIYHDWPKGVPVMMRNPDDPELRAVRSVVEFRPLPLYPNENAWVLERWSPPSRWGWPELWYSPIDQGGTLRWCRDRWMPMSGLYPTYGDYEETSFYLRNDELSAALVAYMIGLIEHALAEMPASPFQRILMAVNHAQQAEDKKYDEYGKWCEEMLRDENPFAVNTPGARAEVCRMAESIGIREHPFS